MVLPKSTHPWVVFLRARFDVILWLHNSGNSDAEIARILSMDTLQVTLIRMTTRDELS